MHEQQLEEQKIQEQNRQQPLSEDKETATTMLSGGIALAEDMEVSFQPQMAPDFTQAFSDQFQNISAEKEKFLLTDNATPSITNRTFSVNINTCINLKENNIETGRNGFNIWDLMENYTYLMIIYAFRKFVCRHN